MAGARGAGCPSDGVAEVKIGTLLVINTTNGHRAPGVKS
jgi:hypothetical protein